MLLEMQRISAGDDAEAIFKSQQLFAVHGSPEVIGFMLTALGLRRSDDCLVHNYTKRSGAFGRETSTAPEKAMPPTIAAAKELAFMVAAGQTVAEIPPCIGFSL